MDNKVADATRQTPERAYHLRTDKELAVLLPTLPLEQQIEVLIGKYVGGAMTAYDGETTSAKADAKIARHLIGKIRPYLLAALRASASPQTPEKEKCEHAWVVQMIQMPGYQKPGASKCSKCGAFFGEARPLPSSASPSAPPADLLAELVAALKACEALYSAEPRKLDEALTWRHNDTVVRGMVALAISKGETALRVGAPRAETPPPTRKPCGYCGEGMMTLMWECGNVACGNLEVYRPSAPPEPK